MCLAKWIRLKMIVIIVRLLCNTKKRKNMNDLDRILNDIDQYSQNIEDLVRALIRAGVNDFEEFREAASDAGVPVRKSMQDEIREVFAGLEQNDWNEALRINTEEAYQNYLVSYPYGNYRDEARDKKKELQSLKKEEEQQKLWNELDKDSKKDLEAFIEKYPDSKYCDEARSILKKIKNKKDGKKALLDRINTGVSIFNEINDCLKRKLISKNDLIELIREDNNLFDYNIAKSLYDRNLIDFAEAGIEDEFIQIFDEKPDRLESEASGPLEKITKSPCTEVYFWGVPASGKTCALGAIMSCANNGKVAKSMTKDPKCQGYGYMTRLANIFKSDGSVGVLPAGTAVSSTYEMGFELEDEKGKILPITCIDLAGELFLCMHRVNAKESVTDEQQGVLNTLTDVLVDNKTDNRKIHFFVIEYGAEKKEFAGLPQRDYLDSAAAYIQERGIFKNDTVGVYILITKVDKVKTEEGSLKEKLRSYMSENYRGFYNKMERICKENEINGGKVSIQPFTLGKVCFQDYCKFDEKCAADVVKIIMNTAYGTKNNMWQKIVNLLKK